MCGRRCCAASEAADVHARLMMISEARTASVRATDGRNMISPSACTRAPPTRYAAISYVCPPRPSRRSRVQLTSPVRLLKRSASKLLLLPTSRRALESGSGWVCEGEVAAAALEPTRRRTLVSSSCSCASSFGRPTSYVSLWTAVGPRAWLAPDIRPVRLTVPRGHASSEPRHAAGRWRGRS